MGKLFPSLLPEKRAVFLYDCALVLLLYGNIYTKNSRDFPYPVLCADISTPSVRFCIIRVELKGFCGWYGHKFYVLKFKYRGNEMKLELENMNYRLKGETNP